MRKKAKTKESLNINHPQCEVEGCELAGEHRAPKHKGGGFKDYHHFCLEHVREFNKNYDFFTGMSEDAIMNFRHDAITGHRPTWRIGEQADLRMIELEHAFAKFWSDTPPPISTQIIPKNIADALGAFELIHPTDKLKIKAQYKSLVKKYHPDINKSEDAAEKFKKITSSYNILIEHYS